jgi:hypothetical protein
MGNNILPVKARACADRSADQSLPKVVWTPGGRQVLVVRGKGDPNTGACPFPLQPVEIPAAGALEEGGEGNGLESGGILLLRCMVDLFNSLGTACLYVFEFHKLNLA